jgi:serine/threonine protein kinase
VALAPGDVFAGYTVVRQLGSGGMGAVYLVRHPRLPRHDALKLLNRELSTEPDFVARFVREADVVASLSHPNIVSIYDRGEENGQLWLTMRFVDGTDGEAALAQAGGLLPAPRVVHIVAEVAAALDAAHRQNLVHRDVKPANILLSESDDDEAEQVFLTDFGIAKSLEASSQLTRTGLVVATFDYASPEQIEARPLDSRSDVYSLGCVLYKLLSGSVPFPGETMLASAAGHLSLPPPKPTALAPWLTPALDDVVARAMAKDPADRFPTCRALATAAAAAMNDFPAAPAPPYSVVMSRTANGASSGPQIGPVPTDSLPAQQTDRLVDLLRRTRFFDLPERLDQTSSGRRQVTIEIGCAGRAHRVVADPDSARRPPELEDLIATIETITPLARPAQPVTSIGARVTAPPTRRDIPVFSPPDRPPVPRQPEQAAGGGQAPAEPQQSPPGPGWTPPGQSPGPPWSPTPEPQRRGRAALWISLVVALLVAAGVTVWFLTQGDDGGGQGTGGTGSSSSASASGSPTAAAQAAYDKLPRAGTALGDRTLVAPLLVDGNLDLYLVDANGTLGARLTSGAQRDVGPLLSTDRRTLVYTRQDATVDENRELWTMGVDGQGDRALFDPPLSGCREPGRPAWNPADQTQLAVVCYGESPLTLRIVSLDGVVVRQLTPPRAYIDDLAFSPDGTELTYWAADSADAGQGRLYVQAADGSGEPRALSDGEADNDPAWSPDGSTIAFSRGVADKQREIYVVPAAGGDAHSILAADGSSANGPAFSPDSSQIVFKSDRPGGTNSGFQWWIMGADGADPHQVPTEGRAVATPAWGSR